MEHYLKILDIERGASWEEIKKAHRELMLVWHPDRFENDADLKARAEKKSKEINEAYDALRTVFERTDAATIANPGAVKNAKSTPFRSPHARPAFRPGKRRYQYAVPQRGILQAIATTVRLVWTAALRSFLMLFSPPFLVAIVSAYVFLAYPRFTLRVSAYLSNKTAGISEHVEKGLVIVSRARDRDF
jgi:hypothetical protein